MKRTLLTLALLVSFLSMYAADINQIATAFKNGNASSLSGSMDSEVELILPSVNKKYPGNEAIKLLTGFFNQNKPSSFSVLHKAEKKESGFYVGKLTTSGGEYRVNITYKGSGNALIIQSIRIE